MKAIGYVRISTVGQLDGVSAEMQAAKIQAWAALHDADLIETFTDTLSGKTIAREGLQQALAAVRQQKATLICYSLSRLSRSTRDTLQIADELRQAGCDLVLLNEQVDTRTPSGRMVFTMLAAMNQFEREQLAERTRHAMQHMKAQGKRVGSIPHGFRVVEGGLEPEPAEQEILRLVAELRKGGLSLRAISDELAKRGAFNREGREFNPKSIRAMLKAA